jgi:lycopene cyclase domain-containing protein
MIRYLLLNTIVLGVVVLYAVLKQRHLFTKKWAVALVILLCMTAVFDSLIVGNGIVAYNPNHYLGLFIGKAPIEDFFYTIAALIVVPCIWNVIGKTKRD